MIIKVKEKFEIDKERILVRNIATTGYSTGLTATFATVGTLIWRSRLWFN